MITRTHNTFEGMTERQISAEFRKQRLDSWLRRQEMNARHNEAFEAAERFKKQLDEWAVSPDMGAVAPTFHFHQHVC